VDDVRWAAFEAKREAIEREAQRLRATWLRPATLSAGDAQRVLGREITREHSLFELLRRPDVGYSDLMTLPGAGATGVDPKVAEQVEIQAKYAGYIERQNAEIERTQRYEHLALPDDLDYAAVRGLSTEVREKLVRHRPTTLGQAGRVPGVTPAAVSLLLVYLKKRGGMGDSEARGAP